MYCRLRKIGVKSPTAQRMCLLYERLLYNLVLK